MILKKEEEKRIDKQKPIERRGKNQSGDTVYLYKNSLKERKSSVELLFNTVKTFILPGI